MPRQGYISRAFEDIFLQPIGPLSFRIGFEWQMADGVKALTKVLCFMAELNKPSKAIKKADLPSAVATALKQFESDENIPVDNEDTDVKYFQILLEGTGVSEVFIAD